MRHGGRAASCHAILEGVWGPSENIEESTLDAFVRLLRRKIDENEPIKRIHRQRLRLLYYSAHRNESLTPSCLRTCRADAIRPSSESEDSFILISKIRD